MTAPSYTEDLTDIATGDETSGWVELTGNSYNAQGAPAYGDNEYPYIQGSYAVTQDTTKNTSVGSLAYSSGGITVPTDGAVFVWHNYSSPFAFGSYAQGGFRICLGSGLADFYAWYTGGNDKDSYPYGGWVNHVVNPTVSPDDTAGSPTGTIDYVGSAVYVISGPGKGEPHQVDVMRYGRGSAIFEYGETSNYCTIAGFAAVNDNQSYRYGLIQSTPGGYLWKGRMQLGTASNAVDFRDSNKTIFIQWTPKVTINFNTVEVINASSNVEMTGFTFQCLDTTTASRGRWLNTDNATVVLDTCTFIDMYTFVFGSNTVLSGCSFRRCNQITQAGADIDGCLFSNSVATVALLVSNLNNIDGCDFVSTGTGHAIQLTSDHAGNSYTLTDTTFTGYATSDGDTGNECIYNNSGGAVTITIDGGDTPTIRNGSGSSTTIVSGAVTVKVTVKDAEGTNISSAKVFLRASNGTGPFPYYESVTISNSGTTATVSHTGHGMATTDKVVIYGAEYNENNGVHSITVTGVDSYTYTMSSAPGDGSVSGTITSTFVALYGDTDINGEIETSRVYSASQPVTGWARKSSSTPYYKQGPIVGSISNTTGFDNTAILIRDE